jgi:hypothetical protein
MFVISVMLIKRDQIVVYPTPELHSGGVRYNAAKPRGEPCFALNWCMFLKAHRAAGGVNRLNRFHWISSCRLLADRIANEMPIARCVCFRSNRLAKEDGRRFMCFIGETLGCTWPSVTKFDSESALRHTSRRCDTLSDRRALLRSSRCALESKLPRFGIVFASMQSRGLGRNGFAPEPKSGFQRKQSAKRYRS